MKKHFLLLTTILWLGNLIYAQQWCTTDEVCDKFFSAEQKQQMEEKSIRIAKGLIPISGDRSGPYTIPCVVHVIHDGGEGNISYEQILDGMDILNQGFNKLNADTSATRNTAEAPFAPIAADMEIEFELAKLDPDGECTNGVQRRYAPHLTNNSKDDECKLAVNGGLDGWPNDKYLNIWIVNSIQSSGSGTILGYAYFPTDSPGYEHGILIRHDAFGTIGTSSADGETLTHEVGHILGLRHIFQDGCHDGDCTTQGDKICDTPPQSEATYGCLFSENSCSDVPVGDYYGFDAYCQIENWMSYNSCQNMFTEGQKDYVHTTIEAYAFLSNWVSPANLVATGVGLPDVLCKADFSSDKTTICAGNSVSYTDFSYANVTGWTWTFEGGTPASSSSENPTVLYHTPGVYDVTLEVTDGTGTETVTLEDYMLVLPDPGEPLPYKEHFETITTVPDNDRFMVPGGPDSWQLADVGLGTDHSVYVPNYLSFFTGDHELISGTIDQTGATAGEDLIFYFHYAYRRMLASNDEKLKFYVSNDCGETWTLRKNIDGEELGTETSFLPFTPTSQDWKYMLIDNINTPYFISDFRYKFVFEADNGNDIYIDNINVYPESMVGELDLDIPTVMEMYPNPTNDEFTLKLFTSDDEHYSIDLYSALGQKIETIYSGEFSSGKNQVTHSVANLPSGIYVVQVESDGKLQTLKLIKE